MSMRRHYRFWAYFYPINKEAPQSFDWRASFLVVTPTGFDLVTEGHDAERARDSIMPRSAAT